MWHPPRSCFKARPLPRLTPCAQPGCYVCVHSLCARPADFPAAAGIDVMRRTRIRGPTPPARSAGRAKSRYSTRAAAAVEQLRSPGYVYTYALLGKHAYVFAYVCVSIRCHAIDIVPVEASLGRVHARCTAQTARRRWWRLPRGGMLPSRRSAAACVYACVYEHACVRPGDRERRR